MKRIEELESNPAAMYGGQGSKASFMKKLPNPAQTPSSNAMQSRPSKAAEYFKRLSMSSLSKRESTTNASSASRQSNVNAMMMAQHH